MNFERVLAISLWNFVGITFAIAHLFLEGHNLLLQGSLFVIAGLFLLGI
jgi:hypothetical protein